MSPALSSSSTPNFTHRLGAFFHGVFDVSKALITGVGHLVTGALKTGTDFIRGNPFAMLKDGFNTLKQAVSDIGSMFHAGKELTPTAIYQNAAQSPQLLQHDFQQLVGAYKPTSADSYAVKSPGSDQIAKPPPEATAQPTIASSGPVPFHPATLHMPHALADGTYGF